jgi:DNA-binding XRE family transcriptional regulator
MNVQIISSGKKPQFAVIPFDEWQKLQDRLENLEDIADARTLSARIASGEDETFPGEFVDRLLSGEHPLTVWREFRGMTGAALASACGVSAPAISQIESGKREPSAPLLKRMATTLRCNMDDLMPAAD